MLFGLTFNSLAQLKTFAYAAAVSFAGGEATARIDVIAAYARRAQFDIRGRRHDQIACRTSRRRRGSYQRAHYS